MEPGNSSSERSPSPAQSEYVTSVPSQNTEAYDGLAGEVQERTVPLETERSSRPEQQHQPPVALPQDQTTLPAPQPAADDASTTTVSDDLPLVAGDDDVIEKEWVDKAKRIITETKDEPYRREQEVKKLQIEYVRKRYGREIGDPGD